MRKFLASFSVAACLWAVAGCGGTSEPVDVGKPFEPPRELDQMKNEMMDRYKKGELSNQAGPSSSRPMP